MLVGKKIVQHQCWPYKAGRDLSSKVRTKWLRSISIFSKNISRPAVMYTTASM